MAGAGQGTSPGTPFGGTFSRKENIMKLFVTALAAGLALAIVSGPGLAAGTGDKLQTRDQTRLVTPTQDRLRDKTQDCTTD